MPPFPDFKISGQTLRTEDDLLSVGQNSHTENGPLLPSWESEDYKVFSFGNSSHAVSRHRARVSRSCCDCS